MAGMGPPPKPAGTRARRNATVATTTLKADARDGKTAPAWPLRPDNVLGATLATAERAVERLQGERNATSDRRKIGRIERELDSAEALADATRAQIEDLAEMELELWVELWQTPQAQMWEQLAWSREVAQYVRLKIRGELGDLDSAKEARQWSDRLGLNPLALLRLRWEIERAEEAEQRGKSRRSKTPGKDDGVPQPKRDADPRSIFRVVS